MRARLAIAGAALVLAAAGAGCLPCYPHTSNHYPDGVNCTLDPDHGPPCPDPTTATEPCGEVVCEAVGCPAPCGDDDGSGVGGVYGVYNAGR